MTPNLFILVFPKTQKNVFGAGDVLLVGIDTRMSVDVGCVSLCAAWVGRLIVP